MSAHNAEIEGPSPSLTTKINQLDAPFSLRNSHRATFCARCGPDRPGFRVARTDSELVAHQLRQRIRDPRGATITARDEYSKARLMPPIADTCEERG
jgi:hypothetical protein